MIGIWRAGFYRIGKGWFYSYHGTRELAERALGDPTVHAARKEGPVLLQVPTRKLQLIRWLNVNAVRG